MNLQLLGRLEERALMEQRIQALARNGKPLQVLEAGCGHKWPFKLEGIDYNLTGIDLDEDALDIRKNRVGDLHEAIVGDLRTAPLEAGTYDLIYSSFVLEHIAEADQVMKNFTTWLKPGGVLMIRIPDPASAQGLVTRITPHWFHVWYYRSIVGDKTAGTPGHGPYPTYFHPVVSRRGMREFCQKHGLKFEAEYGDADVKPGLSPARQKMIRTAKVLVGALSLGTVSHRHTNLLFILNKPGPAEPHLPES